MFTIISKYYKHIDIKAKLLLLTTGLNKVKYPKLDYFLRHSKVNYTIYSYPNPTYK